MRASVVIRSRNEADRLRLTLASLASQTEAAEVVVVNDGSTDHTAEVIEDARAELDIVSVHHARPAGRSAAANTGGTHATGDILIFLDGDTLAGPDLVADHLAIHRQRPGVVVRGENFHLRCTRPFLDPERGTPRPGEEERVARMSEAERARAIVTRAQVTQRFDEIDHRAQAGVYPGFGPRKLYELEMEALRAEGDCGVLWAAAAGANQSVPRDAFARAGGFHPDISINEHRELALRLCQAGLKMVAGAARSYHLIHRSGWRDPLEDKDWEDIFYQAHPRADVALLPLLWQSLSDTAIIPEDFRILSLPHLAEIAGSYEGLPSREAVREAYMAAREATLSESDIRSNIPWGT
ncbi:glycosyl transferase family 2 [Gluconacetobacter diazotrophicus PA1 5]|uniref:glycosyltransferase family 2 protein n=1 Tax=Gluconacetobacter diazotrophicus TaxID=33996 RepID=UPI000173B09F|nr:glycosyltransferase family 2 protein [Gluconacetobacter diazotrophicus]ACI50536.1 glycosyl transferase family 2 [Gluconacetobacter diazotrophicus PA1 5]